MCSCSESPFDALAFMQRTLGDHGGLEGNELREISQPFMCEIDKDLREWASTRYLGDSAGFDDVEMYLTEPQYVFKDHHVRFSLQNTNWVLSMSLVALTYESLRM